jgi:hypothetical protein
LPRGKLADCPHWQHAFANQRKDHRYYELVEDTIEGFDYRYLVIRDARGDARSIQPFFILDQDLIAGTSEPLSTIVGWVRSIWPRFLKARTLMVGCTAGEGHLDAEDDEAGCHCAQQLALALPGLAKDLGVSLIVMKEFPARYRETLQCFSQQGFTRVPSLPMTRLNIDYASFGEYMEKALNSATRKKLRKKFKCADESAPIDLSIVSDVTPIVDEVYPLYLQVYERSPLHFEKLTKEYLSGLGRLMPDKVRFFVWRQRGKIIAFSACMFQSDAMYAEYVGFDYSVALDLHLYHYVVRDMLTWAIGKRYHWFRSSALNYDPKLHLRHVLDPIDLYVIHRSRVVNAVLKRALPLLEPTRYDKTLPKFPNYGELWGR